MKKFIFFFLLTSSLFFFAVGQNLRFGRLSVEKGLSQSTVYCTYQDSQGYIWVGTEDGLNKYDGYTFDIYKFDPTDSTTLSNNIVRCIFEDKQNNLWIGTDNGLNKLNPSNGSFIRYQNIPGNNFTLSSNIITSITQDNKNGIWIGTNNGLNKLDLGSGSFSSFKSIDGNTNSLSSNFISVVYFFNNKLWVGTASNGLNQFDIETHLSKRISSTSENSLSENEVSCISSDKKGNLWVGTLNGGVNIISSNGKISRFNMSNGLSSNSVFAIHEDNFGTIWFGTFGGGLDALNLLTNKITNYHRESQNSESISSNKIYHLFEDNAGTIWISTANGLSFYNRTIAKFTTLKINDNGDAVSNNSIFSICEDRQGNVWTGSLGSGLNVFSRNENRFVNEKFPSLSNPLLRFSNVFSITVDKNDIVWIGTSDGLLSYNKTNGSISEYKTSNGGLSNNYVRCVIEDKSGQLWIGTHGGGIDKLNKVSGKSKIYKKVIGDDSSLSSDVVVSIYEDKKGQLWIATYGGGLCLFDQKTEKFTAFKNNPADNKTISSNFIHSIFEDVNGNLLIGTYGGGLNIFDQQKKSFSHYTEKDGLPNNIINSIISDSNNNIWLSTNNGVCKLNIHNDQKILTADSRSYNIQDGLQNKFNENSSCLGKGGWLYFGGSNGLNVFHPDSIVDNTVIPPVVITRFYLFEKPARMDTLITSKHTLNLNYKQNFFSFEFAALNYLFPDKNRYAYMMENLNDEWTYSGTRRYATYTNIDPGEYIFRVKACNNDGVWNETGIAIKITIEPPIWKTKWFIALFALLITGLIFLYIRFRTNSLVKQNVLLEDKVNLRTSELQVKNIELTKTMENLKTTQTQLVQSEKMASLGQLTAGIAHEIQNPLNFVNNFSELSVDLITELQENNSPDDQKELTETLKQNMEKINFHGKRADSIVKGMLQHSRTSTVEKQPTDINKLVEEFLNLAYHGMRSKDPGFNCKLEKHLGKDVPSIKIISQDISRVILNIFNNAFYAVDERIKSGENNYIPTVSITTESKSNQLIIKIKDNGFGVSKELKDKIFNPFFTTKPTGQGTGLGLSISYDIVVKGHAGDLTVDSIKGEFTEFTISLPL